MVVEDGGRSCCERFLDRSSSSYLFLVIAIIAVSKVFIREKMTILRKSPLNAYSILTDSKLPNKIVTGD